ncbi:1-hydroxycarotenoid 3,4-desaturase CrtD [Ruegeria profundi]|nr:1-hydroxycarotenoid 3,4-desaturase CrtD [Ruegeria profundi]
MSQQFRMNPTHPQARQAVVIGAGIGGLCSAARLCAAGFDVTVLEQHDSPGGKIRTLPSDSGPVDAGPTVLTLRHIFDDVFRTLSERLDDHLDLIKLPVIARHFWPDGSVLDLLDKPETNRKAIAAFSGQKAQAEFRQFQKDTKALFVALDQPMMNTPEPTPISLGATILRHPKLLPAMAPLRSLSSQLAHRFSDRRLAQLFSRYATYVGGLPHQSPALLSLIWQAEAAGVWCVQGGMQALPKALEALCKRHGVQFRYNSAVASIECEDGQISRIALDDGTYIQTNLVIFNGDPRALAAGALGPDVATVAPQTLTTDRSLSAVVWSFDAVPHGLDLSHHNVFFTNPDSQEFHELQAGLFPREQSIYICAQDRGPQARHEPGTPERFEIILNAPPLRPFPQPEMEFQTCQTRTFDVLRRFGLIFDPQPGPTALTRPADFEQLFPESRGSLYGQSPHGLMAALKRPRARTPIKGLYLAGGGTHPGAGLPMAALSARHAVETILQDRISTLASRQTDMRGGMSTESARIRHGQSRS